MHPYTVELATAVCKKSKDPGFAGKPVVSGSSPHTNPADPDIAGANPASYLS